MNTFIRDREQMLSDVKAAIKHGGWEVEEECNDLVVTWNRNDSVRISLDYDRIEYWCEGEWCIDFVTYFERDPNLEDVLANRGKSYALARMSDMLHIHVIDNGENVYWSDSVCVGIWYLDDESDTGYGFTYRHVARVSVC